MIFKLMKLHKTSFFFFYEAPYKHNRIVNEMITFLPLKVFTDYADMQKDSL